MTSAFVCVIYFIYFPILESFSTKDYTWGFKLFVKKIDLKVSADADGTIVNGRAIP